MKTEISTRLVRFALAPALLAGFALVGSGCIVHTAGRWREQAYSQGVPGYYDAYGNWVPTYVNRANLGSYANQLVVGPNYYGQPNYAQPVYVQPVNTAPVYVYQPAYAVPRYAAPVYVAPPVYGGGGFHGGGGWGGGRRR